MYDSSRELLYALLAVPALVVGFFALLLGIYALFTVFSLGLTGWYVLAFIALAAMATKTWIGDDGAATVERTNCPDCGAPNPVEAESCEYCEALLVAPQG